MRGNKPIQDGNDLLEGRIDMSVRECGDRIVDDWIRKKERNARPAERRLIADRRQSAERCR